MTSSSSLYGTAVTQNTSSTNSTSLYGEPGTPVPDASGNVIVRGDLTVLSGNILTTALTGNIFPQNATTLNIGLAATTVNIGASTGNTYINNLLNAPDAKFGNITIAVATDNTITTTTGNLILTSATNSLQLNSATNILYNENNDRANRPQVQSTTGNSSGWRVLAPNATTSAQSNLTVFGSNDIDNGEFLSLRASGSTTIPFNIRTGKYTAGVLGTSGKSINFIDNVTTYATINPAGPTIGTDLTTKAYVDSQELNTTYTIDASTTSGGANFNLQGSDATTDTIKFASGTGITVSRTDANTITVTNAGVTSITGTANQVIASAATGAVTLSLPQSIATTSTPTFAGATLGAIKVGVTTDNTIDTTSGGLTIAPATGIITVSAPTTVQYAEANDRTKRFQFQSSSGNSSGVRVLAPNTTASANATISAFGSSDNSNGSFINLRANNSGTNALRIQTGTYTAGVLGASSGAAFVDNVTTYATVNPAGPSASTDLTTVAYIGGLPAGGVSSVTGGTHVSASPTTGAVVVSTDATNLNTASTIVARDASGNFTAGTITAALTGNATTATTANKVANSLTAGTHLSGGPFDGSAAVTLSTDATNANTASTIVARDASGNFSAGTITAALNGNATTATTATTANKVANSLTAGTHLSGGPFDGSAAVTLSTDATNANTASTIVARDASGNFSAGTVTANLADMSYVLGQLIYTPTTAYSPPTSALTTLTGTNGIAVASSTGNNASLAVRYSSGDTTAGTNSSASIVLAATSGTSTAPGGCALNQVLGNFNIDGYTAGTSNNFASQIATINQGAGTAAINPLQIQGYARQAFTNSTTTATTVTGASGTGTTATLTFTAQNTAPYVVGQTVAIAGMTPSGYNNAAAVITAATTSSISYANTTTGFTSGGTITAANTVTAAGMGFRVRGFANSTNMTAANRINFIDFTTSAANFKSAAYSFADDVITGTTLTAKTYMSLAATVGTVNQDTFTVKNTAATSTYASFAATVGTVNQDTFTVKNTAATSTYATLNSTAVTLNGDTVSLRNSAGTTTYGAFTSTGTTITGAGLSQITRTTVGTPTVVESRPSFNIQLTRSDQAAPTSGDGTGFRSRVAGSNGTNYTMTDLTSNYSNTGDYTWAVSLANGDQTGATFSSVTTIQSKVSATTISAGTPSATPGASTVATKLTVDASKITAAVPFVFPNYTIAAAGAITGAVGWQIAISDSPIAAGRMAFWSTTATAGWRYVDTNLAI